MHTCGYPIYHTISFTGEGYTDYTITLNGATIYTGRVYPFSSGGSVDIDISKICREYLDTSFENSPNLNGVSSDAVGIFAVNGTSYQICYNYNTDYILDIPTGTVLNEPLTDYVDTRQYIGVSTLTGSGITASHTKPSGAIGETITIGDYEFEILPECNSRYALYYVNKNGGLDYLICNGKAIDKYNAKRIDATLYTDQTNSMLFANTHTNQYIYKQYELNTGYISEDRAQNIDHLIYSPKVWLHNLQDDSITSCLINDNNYSVKRFKNNGLINYTINVTQSQHFIRK